MATLTVWKFDSAGGAENALDLLERMQKEELIKVNDAAYVYWVEGKKKPKTEQLRNMTGAGALGGSFWGLLFGLIFFVPLLGMAVGAAMGALAGSMADVGHRRRLHPQGPGRGHPRDVGAVRDDVERSRRQGAGGVPDDRCLVDLDQPVQRAGSAAARGLRRTGVAPRISVATAGSPRIHPARGMQAEPTLPQGFEHGPRPRVRARVRLQAEGPEDEQRPVHAERRAARARGHLAGIQPRHRTPRRRPWSSRRSCAKRPRTAAWRCASPGWSGCSPIPGTSWRPHVAMRFVSSSWCASTPGSQRARRGPITQETSDAAWFDPAVAALRLEPSARRLIRQAYAGPLETPPRLRRERR